MAGAAVMLAAGAWAWRGRRGPAMALAVAVLAVWAVAAVREHPPAQATFAAWDVGQGASSALMLPDGLVLAVDAPGRRGSRFNGGAVAAEALRAMGLTHVDVLAATHAQSDHMGGMATLIARLNRVGELWLPDVPAAHRRRMTRELVAAARKRGVAVRWLARGDVVRLGGVTAQALWPPRGYAPANPNNASLVLSLAMPDGKRLLLPGDVEARAEASLVRAGIGRHALALMPHHGSATSSTPAFVRAVHPDLAIAQTGAGNRYGFPNSEVVRRWRRAGATVANTADGAVMVDLSGARAAWRHAPPVQSARRTWALRFWRQG
ncbi:MAG: hypothetical protein D6824_01945 [Planctomycetota bacterium]|nr:MAG: hypothetical protein D6824_01945 [Planctomycetota bacterium]